MIPPVLIKPLIYGAIVIGIFAAGWFKGNAHGTQKLTDFQGKQAIEAVRIVTRQGAVTERVVTEYRDRAAKTRTVTETIEKDVIRYVESKPLTLSCTLDATWVRLHDAAAGSLPNASASTDDPATGPTAASALPTITGNYRTYQEVADRLRGLQAWVKAQGE